MSNTEQATKTSKTLTPHDPSLVKVKVFKNIDRSLIRKFRFICGLLGVTQSDGISLAMENFVVLHQPKVSEAFHSGECSLPLVNETTDAKDPLSISTISTFKEQEVPYHGEDI